MAYSNAMRYVSERSTDPIGDGEVPCARRSRISGSATLGRSSGGLGALGAAGGSHTLGRAPHNGKYATLSKQCKTLESSDFY
ncbi:unnamed protein product, partial [Iphiclides podalirius]